MITAPIEYIFLTIKMVNNWKDVLKASESAWKCSSRYLRLFRGYNNIIKTLLKLRNAKALYRRSSNGILTARACVCYDC